MWAAAIVALMVGGPLGACLFLAAGITHFIKVTKVDSEYAKQGKTPPSHALIEKWLDSRAKKGAKPQKIAKPGMWRYAWQRWQAMWEDLGEQHREVRDQYKTAAAKAKAAGEVPPPKPTLKESLTGWKWHLDQLTAPTPVSTEPTTPTAATIPAATAAPNAERKPSPRPQPASMPPSRIGTPGMNWPTRGVCSKCGEQGNLTAVGQCEPCVMAGEHGFCSRCNSLMVRDGDVFRHGPHQDCDAVAPATNKVSTPASAPIKPGHCRCGQRLIRWRDGGDLVPACPVCDGVHSGTPERGNCHHCLQYGYRVQVRVDRGPTFERKTGRFFIHEMTGTAKCPTDEQAHTYEQMRPQDRPGPDTALQQILSQAHRTEVADARRNPAPATQTNLASGTPNQQGDTMTQATTQTQQAGEVVGLTSAINYATAVAQAHEAHSTGGGEQYRASLGQAKVGTETIQSAARAQELSEMAGAAWRAHAEKLQEQVAAKEATTAETGSKEFLLSE